MIRLLRTNSSNPDFVELVKLLNADLAQRDGEEHSFYAQFNGIARLKYVVVLYAENVAVCCGALKEMDDTSMEVKRMFTLPHFRKKGLASQVLSELERWALELGMAACRLETGKKQPEAVALYKRNGYKIIPNYGPYKDVENSLCFEKDLTSEAKAF